MAFLEYEAFDGLGLAKLVEDGEVTAAELVEAAIERAEKHGPRLNALVYKMYDLARDAAHPRRLGEPRQYFAARLQSLR